MPGWCQNIWLPLISIQFVVMKNLLHFQTSKLVGRLRAYSCIVLIMQKNVNRWQGELNAINNHLGNNDGCEFEEMKCSNECGKMIER